MPLFSVSVSQKLPFGVAKISVSVPSIFGEKKCFSFFSVAVIASYQLRVYEVCSDQKVNNSINLNMCISEFLF